LRRVAIRGRQSHAKVIVTGARTITRSGHFSSARAGHEICMLPPTRDCGPLPSTKGAMNRHLRLRAWQSYDHPNTLGRAARVIPGADPRVPAGLRNHSAGRGNTSARLCAHSRHASRCAHIHRVASTVACRFFLGICVPRPAALCQCTKRRRRYRDCGFVFEGTGALSERRARAAHGLERTRAATPFAGCSLSSIRTP